MTEAAKSFCSVQLRLAEFEGIARVCLQRDYGRSEAPHCLLLMNTENTIGPTAELLVSLVPVIDPYGSGCNAFLT